MPTYFHGDHASTFISGAWLRGLHTFDLQRAYQLILKNATVAGRGGRPYLEEYMKQGWIAEKDTFNVPTWDEYKAAVTKTLEYAYDDYAVGLVARELKDKKNEKLLMERAGNYRNVYDPSTGFMRGRIAANDYFISPLEENGKIHYRRAFNLMLKLNAASKTGGAAPWPPWTLSIQTHKVLGLK